MARLASITAALLLIVGAGYFHGVWSSRWQSAPDLQRAADRVRKAPLQFGDWRGRELATDKEMFSKTGAESYWMRRYRNKRSGETVSAILMCGLSGPMSIHTPDVCYRGVGYEVNGRIEQLAIPATSKFSRAQFRTAVFSKNKAVNAGALRLIWSWGADGRWQAPQSPRFAFRRQTSLYKLYIVHEISTTHGGVRSAVPEKFLRALLPELQRTLFQQAADGLATDN